MKAVIKKAMIKTRSMPYSDFKMGLHPWLCFKSWALPFFLEQNDATMTNKKALKKMHLPFIILISKPKW